MDIEEACRILGVRKGDTEIAVKSKYRKMMFLYHPDSSGGDNENLLRMAQRVNEAYALLRTGSPEEWQSDDTEWQSAGNPNAYMERGIYVDYSFFDIQTPIREVARGRYLWDPYIEEFEMLMKSIHDVCQDVLEEEDRKHHIYSMYDHPNPDLRQTTAIRLFHLMMQEYINPIACIEKLGTPMDGGKSWCFDGAVGIDGYSRGTKPDLKDGIPIRTPVYAAVQDTKIMIIDEDGVIIGTLSFDDDCLYYVITPLIDSNLVKVECEAGELHAIQGGCKGKLDITVIVTIVSKEPYILPAHRKEILDAIESYCTALF